MADKLNITGVILSAGVGSRIMPLSFDTPKPLLPVCNKPIMQYQIEAMSAIGIKDIIVVVSYLKEKIIEYFSDGRWLNVNIRYIEQKKTLGIAHAVGQLENHVSGPFLLFLGDIFIVYRDLNKIIETFYKNGSATVLVVKKEDDPEYIKRNFAIHLNPDGTVKRVIEKPRYIINNLKGCGIYLFDLPIFDAIRRTPRTALRDEYEITNAIQILIEDGYPVHIADIVEWDMNITVPEDLLKCNLVWLKKILATNIIGSNVKLPAGTRVVNSVIGNNVRISQPISICDSVILSGVSIEEKKDIKNSLISHRTVINGGKDVTRQI